MTARAFEVKGPRLTKWVAKKWQPEYERMVAYSALGRSNKEIALMMKYTPEHVSNVLNLPQAKELKDKILAKMRERTLEDVPTLLKKVAQKTAERLDTLINDDELFAKSPLAIIDRGMEVMKGTGYLKGGGNGAPPVHPFNQQNNFFGGIPAGLLDQLNNGMSAANRALEINAPDSDKDIDRRIAQEREG
jgi:hypothetical protein